MEWLAERIVECSAVVGHVNDMEVIRAGHMSTHACSVYMQGCIRQGEEAVWSRKLMRPSTLGYILLGSTPASIFFLPTSFSLLTNNTRQVFFLLPKSPYMVAARTAVLCTGTFCCFLFNFVLHTTPQQFCIRSTTYELCTALL